MEYTKLGTTGMDVSRLCLDCMTFGTPDRGSHVWKLDEEASRPILRKAIEAGINFFDTANVYSDGTSEEIVGRALKESGVRPRASALPSTPNSRTRFSKPHPDS